MRNVKPRIKGDHDLVGENQPQYTPVHVIKAIHPLYGTDPDIGYNTVIMCFEPSPAERQRLINGENIYIGLLTGGEDQEPVILSVGPEDMARWHNLEVQQKPLAFDITLPGCNSVPEAQEQADGAPEKSLSCEGVKFEGL